MLNTKRAGSVGSCFYSNTTFVNVKQKKPKRPSGRLRNSNTTFVNVKPAINAV